MISWLIDGRVGRLVLLLVLAVAAFVSGLVLFADGDAGSGLAAVSSGPAAQDLLSQPANPAEALDGSGSAGRVAAEAPTQQTSLVPLPPTTREGATTTSEASTTSMGAPAAASCDDPWADLAGCGWPGPGNTGPRSANCPDGFADNTGATTRQITITEDGTELRCQRIAGGVEILARDVTIADSIVTFDGGGGNGGGAIVVNGGGSATIVHVEIDGLDHTHACVWHQGESVLVDTIDCHGTTDGVVAWPYVGYSSAAGDHFTVRDSYFHDPTPNASNGHMDGFQTLGAASGLITHNTYDWPTDGTSAFAFWNDVKSVSDITVSGNLVTGAQWTVYAMDRHPSSASPQGGNSVTDVTFSDNVFSTRAAGCVGVWGVWYTDDSALGAGPTDGWQRSGNYVLETSQDIDDGNPDCR